MPYLAFNLNDGNEFVFDILEDRLSIGRDAKNDIVLDNTHISAFHAEFVKQPDGIYELVDLKSSNGTYLNGQRVERARVKGGDRLRFGQLDARFRERTPKGFAPGTEITKPLTGGKGLPARSDGRGGDTQSIPARDATAPVTVGSGSGTPPVAFVPPSSSEPAPAPARDPALTRQADELRDEIAKLKQERELLRAENEKESRRRDEVRALEAKLETCEKAAGEAEVKLKTLQSQIATIEPSVAQLTEKRREAANLDSQIDSNRIELSRVKSDIEVAQTSLQNVHRDAEKKRAELEELRASKVLSLEEMLHGEHAEVAKKLIQLRKERDQVEAKLSELKSQLTEAEAAATHAAEQHGAWEVAIAALATRHQSLETEVTTLDQRLVTAKQEHEAAEAAQAKLQTAEAALTAVETHKAELVTGIHHITRQRDELTRELLAATEKGKAQHALNVTLEQCRDAAEKETRDFEAQKAALTTTLTQVRENLSLAEATLEQRRLELSQTEEKNTTLQSKAADAGQQYAALQVELQQLQTQVATAKAELENSQKEFLQHRKIAEEASDAKANLGSQIETLRSQIAALESQLTTLTSSHAERQKEMSVLDREHKELSEKHAAHQKEAAATEARLLELREQTTAHEKRLVEITASEKKLAEMRAELIKTSEHLDKLRADEKRLQPEANALEVRLTAQRADTQRLQANLAEKLKELAAAESKLAEAKERTGEFGATAQELASIRASLDEAKAASARAAAERERLEQEVRILTTQRDERQALLPTLNTTVEALRAELAEVTQQKTHAITALAKAEEDRHVAEKQAHLLRSETANLEKLLTNKTATLEAETRAKLERADAVDARLLTLAEKVAAEEKHLQELAEKEKGLIESTRKLKDLEIQRLEEEKKIAELSRHQESLRHEIAGFETGSKSAAANLNDLMKRAKAEEARLADIEKKVEKTSAALQAADIKRVEAEAAAAKAREEERILRKQIPALSLEMAELENTVVGLVKQRDESSLYVARLNDSTESANKKLAEIQQQISQLEEAQRVREDRLMKAQISVDKETVRLKNAQDLARSAETTLQSLDKEVKEAKLKSESVRAQATSLEIELRNRLDRVEKLKMEEDRLLKDIESGNRDVQGAGTLLLELQEKVRKQEERLSEYTEVGGRVLSVAGALVGLETRQNEVSKSLRDAAERELALQVKINAHTETMNREMARAEQVKKDRLAAEHELQLLARRIQTQSATFELQEKEQRKLLADLEKRLNEETTHVEKVRLELGPLEQRLADFAQAEAQYKHWQEIESRLRGQLVELEEKHEIMRHGLPTEDATVVMFANDLIKRMDLLDALISRFSGQNGDIVDQLHTFRASVEDILHQHGVTEFDIAAGTEVDTRMRRLIAVVESVPGKGHPRVVETCRPGFVFSRQEGHEIILRKVEVRTSSQ